MSDSQPERAVLDFLSVHGIPHEVMACDPEFADTAAFCEKYAVLPEDSANTIIVASKKDPRQYAACLALATTRVDVNRTVSRLMSVKRVSFADATETFALTGMMAGGVTVFGLPPTIPLLIDSRVMDRSSVIVGGGSRSMKIRIAPPDLLRIPGASVVEGLAMERAEPPAGG